MKRRLLAVLPFLLVSRMVHAATCSPTTFITADSYPAANPQLMAIGDFNGDGKPDIAGAGGNQYLTILLNNGDGTFAPAITSPIGFAPNGMAAASLRGNGTIDLIMTNYGGIEVLLGHGDGTFDPPVYYQGGYYSYGLAIGKFDGNDTLDVATAATSDQAIVLFPGNGDGTFGSPISTAAAAGINALVAGDFDGDGKLDLVSSNATAGTISFYAGLGNGHFGPGTAFVAGTQLNRTTAADFDGDGNLDVAVVSGSFISVLLGNGNGTFQAALQYPAGVAPTSLAAADFDEDGRIDLAVGDGQSQSVLILPGLGGGSFGAAVGYLAGSSPGDIGVADFDGNSLPDVAAATNANAVSVLRNTGSGELRGVPVSAPMVAPWAYGPYNSTPMVARGDWNGDGREDLAWSGYQQIAVVQSLGGGRFVQGPIMTTGDPNNPQPYAVAAGDFDGDGKPDLVASDYTDVLVFPGLGNGSFEAPQSVYQGYSFGILTVADFNGDGKPDVAVTQSCCSGQEPIFVLLGNGDGTFQPAISSTLGFDPFFFLPADLNGDGKQDLVAASPQGVYVLLSNGDGSFQAPLAVGAVGSCCSYFSVATGRFFGASLDLIVSQQGNNVMLFPGNGDGTFGTPVLVAVASTAGQLTAGDYDGDGHDDFAVVSGNQGVDVFLGLGNGHFQSPYLYPQSFYTAALESGDFSGGGPLDIAEIGSGNLAALVNARLGAVVPSVSVLVASPAVLTAAAGGDGPLSYQWRKNGTPISDGGSISGATTASLTIDPATFGDAGSYDVLVTDSCTSATSNAATLSVEFADVPTTNIFHADIITVATAGVTAGCGGANYCPTALVTRAQMSAFLLKSEHGSSYVPPDCTGVFADVACPSPFADWIEQLATEQVTAGCGGNDYCPDASITRAQMAVFLLKTKLGSGYVPPTAVGIFGDVPPGSFAADWIEDLYNRGIAGGCSASPLLYCPGNPVNRAQMAAFLVNTFF